LRTGQSPHPWQTQEFTAALAHSEALISGRFHGTCLGFILGKPVLSVTSNTWKMEGLYRDIGLPADSVANSLGGNFSDLKKSHLDPVAQRMHLVGDYVEGAPAKIAAMFDRIAGLG
jgi:polysaccharide pyruvyl transferase WcaK-like protein